MLKKRLIFTLLYKNNNFFLSRNFRLQKVGGVEWLIKNYNFAKIASSIDELIVLNLSDNKSDSKKFCDDITLITKNCFIPVSLGGGIKSIDDASMLFSNGADKVVINSAIFSDPKLIKEISSRFGSQSIVASVDFKIKNEDYLIYIENGTQLIKYNLRDYLEYLDSLPIGEIILNSIDKDGTGQGFELSVINEIESFISKPIILSGGAGNEMHLLDVLVNSKLNAASTANLFNFISDGLPKARNYLISKGCELARWE